MMNHPISLHITSIVGDLEVTDIKDNFCSLFLATRDQNAKISLMNAADISTTDFLKSTYEIGKSCNLCGRYCKQNNMEEEIGRRSQLILIVNSAHWGRNTLTIAINDA